MSLELKQNFRLSQQLVMTPQLQQAIKLLQLSRLELQDLIRDEMNQNPLLEEPGTTEGVDIPDAGEGAREAEAEVAKPVEKTEEVKGEGAHEIDWDNYLNNYQFTQNAPSGGGRETNEDLPSYEATLTRKTTLFDHLLWQLKLSALAHEEEQLALLIIGNLDDDGYLKLGEEGDPLERLANESGVSLEKAGRLMRKIQMLDPVGVGARDLPECLLIQARALGCERGLVGTVIRRFLKQVESKNYPAIARELKLPLEEIVAAIKIISQMEPKPGRAFTGDDAQYITPDIYVHKVGDQYVTVLNDDGLSKLRLSGHYRDALRNGKLGANGASSEAKEYIQEKLRSAVWLIRSIHQRQRTIFKVTESIVKFQRDFLDQGVAALKPLILRDVADDIGMHESTVSRVTTNKFVHTPQGIYELKYFFNSSIGRVGGGEDLASEAVKNGLRQLIATENPSNPHSDQRLVELMRQQGVEIARRTVAKYREVLGILPSSKRRRYF